MGRQQQEPTIWVIARRVAEKKWHKMKAREMFVTTPDHMYWPFRPLDPTDHDLTTEYGVIQKGPTASTSKQSFMVLHYILTMSEIEEDIVEGIRTGKDPMGNRIPNNKRPKSRRSAPTVLPLHVFTLKSEAENTKAAEQLLQRAKGLSRSNANSKILSAALLKRKAGDGLSASEGHHGEMTTPRKSPVAPRLQNDNLEVPNTNSTGRSFGTTKESSEVQRLNLLLDELRRQKEEAERKLVLQQSQQSQQVSQEEVILQNLADKLGNQLQAQFQNLVSSSNKENERVSDDQRIKRLRNALDPEADPPQLLSSDLVYMGTEEPLKRKDLVSIQRRIFTFPGRVKRIADLMYPGKLHLLYSSKHATDTDIVISDDAIVCTTNILLSMIWTSDEKPTKPISETMVRRVIEQYASSKRSALKNNAKSEWEKEEIKAKKLEQRKARKGKKVYIIKNRKRHYVKKTTVPHESASSGDEAPHNSSRSSSPGRSTPGFRSPSPQSTRQSNHIPSSPASSIEGSPTRSVSSRRSPISSPIAQWAHLKTGFVSKRKRPAGFTEDFMYSDEEELNEEKKRVSALDDSGSDTDFEPHPSPMKENSA